MSMGSWVHNFNSFFTSFNTISKHFEFRVRTTGINIVIIAGVEAKCPWWDPWMIAPDMHLKIPLCVNIPGSIPEQSIDLK